MLITTVFITHKTFPVSHLDVSLHQVLYQLRGIRAAYDGRVVFVCLPTSFGKSVCYQALSFVMDHQRGCSGSAVIVVSPLVALMEDQVSGLRNRTVNVSVTTQSARLTSVRTGTYTMIVCSPPLLRHWLPPSAKVYLNWITSPPG